MIVVDTNIIAAFYLQQEYSALAEQLFQYDQNWLVPKIWRSEFRNVLVFYLRRNLLMLEEANKIMSLAEEMMFKNEYEVHSKNVMVLAASSMCSAYDCEFVCLAKMFEIPLVTLDKQILKAFPECSISLKHFKLDFSKR